VENGFVLQNTVLSGTGWKEVAGDTRPVVLGRVCGGDELGSFCKISPYGIRAKGESDPFLEELTTFDGRSRYVCRGYVVEGKEEVWQAKSVTGSRFQTVATGSGCAEMVGN